MSVRRARVVERVLTRLKFRQLRLLVAIVKFGNIQRAAREVNASQPAATRMIKDLELDFEVRLFERTNRGMVPTVFGEALVRHTRLIFAQVANAAQELADINEGTSGRLVVGTLLAASTQLLPVAIDILVEQRPNVAIKVVEGTNEILMPALQSGEIDMVVGRLSTYRHRAEIIQEKLFDDKVIVVGGARHPLVGRANLTFDKLKPFGWILPPPETNLRRQVDKFFVENDQYMPPVILDSVSYLTNRTVLQSRHLIGIMPSQVPAQDIATGFLSHIDWTIPFGSGPIGVSYRLHGELSPAGKAFLKALREAAAKLPINVAI
ncbi:LysR substrate-binding domain-containing protein [Mesorhizobium sp. SB112]|uniref:LysR substrate-binding domain-containing protein n=1 Tax=Mesorhizobium sp. SB112 TaxID=3151853 RepID=UPI0032644F22